MTYDSHDEYDSLLHYDNCDVSKWCLNICGDSVTGYIMDLCGEIISMEIFPPNYYFCKY